MSVGRPRDIRVPGCTRVAHASGFRRGIVSTMRSADDTETISKVIWGSLAAQPFHSCKKPATEIAAINGCVIVGACDGSRCCRGRPASAKRRDGAISRSTWRRIPPTKRQTTLPRHMAGSCSAEHARPAGLALSDPFAQTAGRNGVDRQISEPRNVCDSGVTHVGTCSVCGRRFACVKPLRTTAVVVRDHNDAPFTRCLGAGAPPVDGTITCHVAGRRIVQPRGRLDEPADSP